MDTTARVEPLTILATLERVARAGLELDRSYLSRQNRLAVYRLQRAEFRRPEHRRPPIGFAYPGRKA